jgi:hypothetical protein
MVVGITLVLVGTFFQRRSDKQPKEEKASRGETAGEVAELLKTIQRLEKEKQEAVQVANNINDREKTREKLFERSQESEADLKRQLEEAMTQLTSFSPLQLEAATLAKDILRFIEEMGPRPRLDRKDFQPKSSDGAEREEEYLRANAQTERGWTLRFISGWEADFKQRVDSIALKFGKAGIDAMGLRKMSYNVNRFSRNNELFEMAKAVLFGALGLDTMKVVPILDEVPK